MHFSSRLRGHGTVYAMIILYSFQFRVTRARHCICHDISSCISVYDYASTLKPQKYMLWYFFIHFSSRLRGHGTVYAMILLCAFQFTITPARGHGTVYAMILFYIFFLYINFTIILYKKTYSYI